MQISRKLLYSIGIALFVTVVLGLYSWHAKPDYTIITEKTIYGPVSATVQLIEFGDIQCPACKDSQLTVNRLKSAYKGQLSFQFYHFPLNNLHRYAQSAAEAVECANDAGKFFEYLDEVYLHSPDLSRSELIKAAEQVGVPLPLFKDCLDSGWKARFVDLDVREGQRKGVSSTPTFFVNGKKAEDRSFATLSSMIEVELGNQKSSNPP